MAMKWYKPEDRTPAFGFKYALMDKGGDWEPGFLKEIKTTEHGEEFIWKDFEGQEIMSDISHYMPIEPPKNNQ